METRKIVGEFVCETLVWTGVGFFVGHQAGTSPELVAAIFAVSMIADKVFSLFNSYTIYDANKLKEKKELDKTNALCSVVNAFVTGVVLERRNLLSNSAAYMLGMGSLAFHLFKLQSKS